MFEFVDGGCELTQLIQPDGELGAAAAAAAGGGGGLAAATADGGGATAVRRVLTLALQLARALAHVHARGVMHNDVKPEHCVVTERGALELSGARPVGWLLAVAKTPLHKTALGGKNEIRVI